MAVAVSGTAVASVAVTMFQTQKTASVKNPAISQICEIAPHSLSKKERAEEFLQRAFLTTG
jgi:hypothetical protein